MHAFRLESLRRHPINAVYDVPGAVGHPVRPALESAVALRECRAVRAAEFRLQRNQPKQNDLQSRRAARNERATSNASHQEGDGFLLASL
jgi:hypothetical protein